MLIKLDILHLMSIEKTVDAVDTESSLDVIDDLSPGKADFGLQVSMSLLQLVDLKDIPFVFASLFAEEVRHSYRVILLEDLLHKFKLELSALVGIGLNGHDVFNLGILCGKGILHITLFVLTLLLDRLLDVWDVSQILGDLNLPDLLLILPLSHLCKAIDI